MCCEQILPEGELENEKKIRSLLLSVIVLCSEFCRAWAEGDKYQVFADRYGPNYCNTFCTNKTMTSCPLDPLNDFLDLEECRLVPQAVQLIKARVPVFARADADDLSDKMILGLGTDNYIPATPEGVPSSETPDAAAFSRFRELPDAENRRRSIPCAVAWPRGGGAFGDDPRRQYRKTEDNVQEINPFSAGQIRLNADMPCLCQEKYHASVAAAAKQQAAPI